MLQYSRFFSRNVCFNLLAAGIVLFAFSSCQIQTEGVSFTKSATPGSPVGDNYVRYIRTVYFSCVENPVVTVLSSKKEYEQYFRDVSSFEEVKAYPDSFFANNFIVVVFLTEGSGSIRHKVERIDEKGDIIIRRLLPEIGTDDMAAWNIIIELNKNFNPKQFGVTFINQ